MSLDATQGMTEVTAKAVLFITSVAYRLEDGRLVDKGGREASDYTVRIIANAQAVLDGLA